ncbi:TetR/AcrR family transcriptional regulator [Jannaschia sp. R86511]|uniref:TetR/AcrR family transcriptional regulator n=1 Tax=Jannaschia sp. R86511 TaxID=3093853 RepID=UPI0036D2D650
MTATSARSPARERLLQAAEQLFYERGIAATGVDAVLRRAQVAPATLYAHFGGKDHLVAAYLERRHERWRHAWDEALERAGDDPVARVLSVFDALADFHGDEATRRGCAFLAAAVEVTAAEHPAARWLAADTALLRERLHDLAVGAGARDPHALAAELLLLYDGALAARTRTLLVPVPADESRSGGSPTDESRSAGSPTEGSTSGGSSTATPPVVRALAADAVARHRAG